MKLITIGFFIIGCVSLSFCLSKEEAKEMVKALLNECKSQEGGSDADMELLMDMTTFPTTNEGKCMIACAHEKIGVVCVFIVN